jgi:hypothetical protein
MNEIKFKSESFKRAMAKAAAKKPLVKIGSKTGQYFVAASDGFSSYQVLFQVGGGGRRLASCLCAGGQKGYFCYHQAAALLAHSSFVRAGLRSCAVSRRDAAEQEAERKETFHRAMRIWSRKY